MNRLIKISLAVDLILICCIMLLFFIGCGLNSESRNKMDIESGRKITFRVYNAEKMLFYQNNAENTKYKNLVNLPNISLIIYDVPPNAKDIDSIVNLHYSVIIGFLPGIDESWINQATYNGHKIYTRITVNGSNGIIRDEYTEDKNIANINKLVSVDYYDGLYISMNDINSIKNNYALFRRVRDALHFVTVNDNICYANKICYLTADTNIETIKKTFENVAKSSLSSGQWTIIIQYKAGISDTINALIFDNDI